MKCFLYFIWIMLMGYLFLNFGTLQNTAMRVDTSGVVGLFVTVWTTNYSGVSDNDQIQLPLIATGEYDFVVDWGDNTTSHITAYNDAAVTHTYPAIGTYTVSITGTIKGWEFDWGGDYLKIVNVVSWGSLEIINDGAFAGCINMNIEAADKLVISGYESLPDDMRFAQYVFGGWLQDGLEGTATTRHIDCSKFDVTNVHNLKAFFYDCDLLTSADLSNWNLGFNVDYGGPSSYVETDVDGLFQNALNLVSVNLSNWTINTEHSISCIYMFYKCYKLLSVDMSDWNVSTSTRFLVNNMFDMCYDLTEIKFPNNGNMIIWSNMSNIFRSCSSITTIEVENWNTSQVLNMSGAFSYCNILNELDLSNWDFRIVSNFTDFLNGTTLSNTSYGKLWDRFYAQKDDMLNTRSFHGGGSKLTSGSSAEAARTYFINTKGWTVVDGDS